MYKQKAIFIIAIFCFLFNNNLKAQENTSKLKIKNILQTTTFELGMGYQFILGPKSPSNISDFNKFGAFHLGARVNLTDQYGLRGFFEHNNFSKSPQQGVKINKLVGELTYRWTYHPLNTNKSPKFSILAHTGGGLGTSNSQVPNINITELIGVAQIGIMPEYKINNLFSIFIDLTYAMHLSVDYQFNGSYYYTGEKFTGHLFIPSFGVSMTPFK